MEGVLSAVEKYIREFVLYLLSFFRGKEDKELGDYGPDGRLNKVLLFGVISAFLGAYLSYWFVQNQHLSERELYDVVIKKALYWITLALLLHVILGVLRVKSSIMESVIAVLSVTPVAYIVAAFAAYVGGNLYNAFAVNGKGVENVASIASNAIQLLILCVYLPREVVLIGGSGQKTRKIIACVAVILVAIAVTFTKFAVYAYQTSQSAEASRSSKVVTKATAVTDMTRPDSRGGGK